MAAHPKPSDPQPIGHVVESDIELDLAKQVQRQASEEGERGNFARELQQSGKPSWGIPESEWYEVARGGVSAEDRGNFIRKVYGILSAQMALTAATCACAMLVDPVRSVFVSLGHSIIYTLLIFVPALAILCMLRRFKAQHPVNYYLLLAFTVLMSLSLGGVCAQYQEAGLGALILEAAGMTAVVFGGLSAYALRSGKDFTWLGGVLTMGLLGLVMFGFLGGLFGFSGGAALALLGVLLFSGFILYDTSRILKVYGPDDAVVAAIELYLDILNLFLCVLQLLSSSRGE